MKSTLCENVTRSYRSIIKYLTLNEDRKPVCRRQFYTLEEFSFTNSSKYLKLKLRHLKERNSQKLESSATDPEDPY